jgi:PAS domain S-box-containing protein
MKQAAALQAGGKGQASMQVRPITGQPRPRYRMWWRLLLAALRWTFLVLGALATASVLFSHLYSVNEEFYDPMAYATGVAGLFSMMCGIMLMVLSRNGRLRLELRQAKIRCEELADFTWELKDAEARAISLLEAQGDLIVRRDSTGLITYANDVYCTLAGAAREQLIGTGAALDVIEQGEVRVMPDGTRMHDQKVATPDGPRWLAWRESVVFAGPGGESEVQGVGRDVTERTETGRALAEARDAAEAASRAKSRFLAMASHEIRTPLNGILGMTDLLLDTKLTPEQTAYVKATKASGDALLSLIEDILDFSKIEAGRLDLDSAPFSPLALAEEVVELLGPRAQAKGLCIACDVDETLPHSVTGDVTRLRQVLLNLAGNAIKFTETGGVAVTVGRGDAPGEIAFEVRDTGIGIAPDQQARIFLEFEQADGGNARRSGGTGLGLAISRRIVERMGGRIAVESTAGAGAAFRFTLPLQAGEPAAPAFIPPSLAGRAVLIVAADTPDAALLERRLTRWGAAVTSTDAAARPAAGAVSGFDTVLLDLPLDTAAATLRDIAGRIARRIVLLTPGERANLPTLKEAGCTGYLVKPVRAASLAARLTGDAPFEDAPAAADAPAALQPGRSLAVLVAEDNEINALLSRSLLERLGHRPTMVTDGAAAVAAWRAAQSAGTPFDAVLMDV